MRVPLGAKSANDEAPRRSILGVKQARVKSRSRARPIGASREAWVTRAIGVTGAFEQHAVVLGLDFDESVEQQCVADRAQLGRLRDIEQRRAQALGLRRRDA